MRLTRQAENETVEVANPWFRSLRNSRRLVAAAVAALLAGGVWMSVQAIGLQREARNARAWLAWVEDLQGAGARGAPALDFPPGLPTHLNGVLGPIDFAAKRRHVAELLETGRPIESAVESLRTMLLIELRLLEESSGTKGAFLILLAAGAFFLAAGHVSMLRILGAQREHMGLLQIRAETDALTGCLNRAAFLGRAHEEWERALRGNSGLAVMMVDLDWFKEINDTFGHLSGDGILRDLALQLRRGLRPYDIVARYGGDEFVVLLPDVDSAEAAELAGRLKGSLFPSVRTSRGRISASCSIGVAARGDFPFHESFERLLLEADRALYSAKREGRGKVVIASASPGGEEFRSAARPAGASASATPVRRRPAPPVGREFESA